MIRQIPPCPPFPKWGNNAKAPHDPAKRCRGFTLIEVLVSLAVVSGVFLVILSSFSHHLEVFDSKKENFRLVMTAKENLYLYKAGRLSEPAGTRQGISYNVKSEDIEYGLKKVISSAKAGGEETALIEYIRR